MPDSGRTKNAGGAGTRGVVRVFLARVRVAVGQAGRIMGREDTAIVAGGLTFYAAIAIVPLLLLTIRACSALTSTEWVVDRFADMALLLPDTLGARAALAALVQAGVNLGPLGIAIAVFPATFYGEGLRRALVRLTPVTERFVGWRGRLLVVPFALFAPGLLLVLLVASEGLAKTTTDGGSAELVLRVWLGFQCLWLVLAVPLAWVYRVVAPHRIRWRTLVAGSLVTSSIIAGFVQGFVLFLNIPVDLGAPFGGLDVIGGGIAVALWMFLLHVLVLVGWVVLYRYDRLTYDRSDENDVSEGVGTAEPSTERNR
ncbi:MAG: YihY/virulence factor BrkB family protein [Rhodococcus sp. (in: high G+C Gram-positive bacteria)]